MRELLQTTFIGTDKSNDFAEVTLMVYKEAEELSYYLRYQVEYEAFSRSGRWYQGKITEQQAESLTVANAKAILEGLESYVVGGSFPGREFSRKGPINIGLTSL